MKELSIEEKAKAYDEALEKAKDYHKQLIDEDNPEWASEIEKIFPELKESEDERIRKRIIHALHGDVLDMEETNKTLAWLEKQGEQKVSYTTTVETGNGGINALITRDIEIPFGAKDSELQEATYFIPKGYYAKVEGDKVVIKKGEPKFHEGEWIIHQGTENIYQVVAVIDNQYQLKYGDNYTIQYCEDVDRCARLWTIKDAKDGDILELDCGIGIFKDNCIDGYNIHCYCYYSYEDVLEINKDSLYDNYQSHPATKEQCERFFVAMYDAGYEWDTDKKELKKIKNSPMLSDFFNAKYKVGKVDAISEVQKCWTEDDKNHMANILNILLMEAKNAKIEQYRSSVESDIDWIYSLKNKVRVQPKQERSDDDEDYINDLIKYFSQNERLKNTKEDIVIWLKSLKDYVQPKQEWSEEDKNTIKVLMNIIRKSEMIDSIIYTDSLKEKLYDWLKSLKQRIGG